MEEGAGSNPVYVSVRIRSPVLCRVASTGTGPVSKTGMPRERREGSSPSHGVIFGRYANWLKQAVCKTVTQETLWVQIPPFRRAGIPTVEEAASGAVQCGFESRPVYYEFN